MEVSRRSRQKFADMAASLGTIRTIEEVYAAQDIYPAFGFEPTMGRARRSVCESAEAALDTSDAATSEKLLRAYLDAVDDWGRRPTDGFAASDDGDHLWPDARALVRSLRRDGAPIDEDGNVLASRPLAIPVERFGRLSEPRVLLQHLERIEAGISADPAAAIGASKELLESTLKFVLDDYGTHYEPKAQLMDLYKAAARELAIDRAAVSGSTRGSASAKRTLQNLASTVQALAELRNELGLGHGKTAPSPALARHARLAANASRSVAEFVLETWHEREGASQQKAA